MANSIDLGPGTTPQQRHYRKPENKAKRAEYRRRPEVAARIRARAAAYKAAHPEKVKAYGRKYQLENREEIKRVNRENNWARKGYPTPTRPRPELCECCGRPPNGSGVLHNDHDHITGKFRGWLCYACNSAIGKLGDSLAGVLRAVDYLMANM